MPGGAAVYVNSSSSPHTQRLAEWSTLWAVPRKDEAAAQWVLTIKYLGKYPPPRHRRRHVHPVRRRDPAGPAHMRPVFVLIVYLAVPGLIPALVAARRSPVVIFLAPLIGAAMAAIAAEIELGVGGSLLTCYLPVVLFVNAAAAVLVAGRGPPPALGQPAAGLVGTDRAGHGRPRWCTRWRRCACR